MQFVDYFDYLPFEDFYVFISHQSYLLAFWRHPITAEHIGEQEMF